MVKQHNQNHAPSVSSLLHNYQCTEDNWPNKRKGGNTTGDIAENPCCILCPVTNVSAYSSVLTMCTFFVFITCELQELVHTIEGMKIDEHYVI